MRRKAGGCKNKVTRKPIWVQQRETAALGATGREQLASQDDVRASCRQRWQCYRRKNSVMRDEVAALTPLRSESPGDALRIRAPGRETDTSRSSTTDRKRRRSIPRADGLSRLRAPGRPRQFVIMRKRVTLRSNQVSAATCKRCGTAIDVRHAAEAYQTG